MTPDGKTDPDKLRRAGHRSRLRGRFLRCGLGSLDEYEAVELLLTYAIPRKDVKPIAKNLMERYGSLSQLMSAPGSELVKFDGLGTNSAALIMLIKALCIRYLEQRLKGRDLLDNLQRLADFIRMKIGGGQQETLMIIYLDAWRQLITFTCTQGTVNHAAVYIRNVVKKAIDCGASGIVIAHNHPSGVCEPTPNDLKLTRELAAALKLVEVKVFDHLLVTATSCRSLLRNEYLN